METWEVSEEFWKWGWINWTLSLVILHWFNWSEPIHKLSTSVGILNILIFSCKVPEWNWTVVVSEGAAWGHPTAFGFDSVWRDLGWPLKVKAWFSATSDQHPVCSQPELCFLWLCNSGPAKNMNQHTAFCIVTKRPWQLPLDPTHAVYYVWTLLMDFCFALLDSTKINIVSHHYPIGSHWESFFRFFFLFWELHGMCMAVIQFSPCLFFSNLLPCLL